MIPRNQTAAGKYEAGLKKLYAKHWWRWSGCGPLLNRMDGWWSAMSEKERRRAVALDLEIDLAARIRRNL